MPYYCTEKGCKGEHASKYLACDTAPSSTAKVRPCNCADPENCAVVPDGYELRCKRLNHSSTAKVRRYTLRFWPQHGWIDASDCASPFPREDAVVVLASDYDALTATLAERDARIAELERFRSVDVAVEVLLRHRIAALETGLRGIAANTCCGTCQEAALVARALLATTHNHGIKS